MRRWTLLGASVPALFFLFVFYPVSGTVTMLPQITPEIPLLPGEKKKGAAAGSLRGRRRLVPGGGAIASAERQSGNERSRRLVTGGTPTGGGKYPFLVLVSYTNGSSEDAGPSPSSFFPVPLCHGVMVAKDVLMRQAWCDVTEGMPLMVGDYDEASSTASVQFISLAGERTIITSPDGELSLEKVGPVTLPGFFPVPVAGNASEPIVGQNVTLVGYGSNSSWYVWNEGIGTNPGVAIEVQLQALVPEYCEEANFDGGLDSPSVFCAAAPAGDAPFNFRAAGPCYGDSGAPILDENGTLMGIVSDDTRCGNRVIPSTFKRISYYSKWIMQNLCTLTDDTEFQMCQGLLCPPEERVLGFPEAEVPDAGTKIKTATVGKPVKVVQFPSAGSPIKSSTTVLVLVTDESGNITSCSWTITVPTITGVAWADEEIASGTYDRNLSLLNEMDLRQGLAVMISADLEHELEGNATLTLSTALNETLALYGVVSGSTLLLQNPFLFQYGVNDLTLQARDIQQGNFLHLEVYGQDKPIEGQVVGEGDEGGPERS